MGRNGIKKQFWLSEKHANKLADFSRKTLLPEVTLIRFLLDGYYPKEAPGKEFHEDMNGLISLKEDLNLAARKTSEEDLKAALWSEAKSIQEMRMKLMEKYLLPEGKERKR